MPGRRAIVILLACLSLAVAAAPAADVAAQQRAAVFGIEVREGRRPIPGVEVRLQSEGPVRGIEPAPQLTDERGRAEFWWLTPGIWRVDLLVDGEVAYFLTVRLEGDRRAEEMGAPARDADAPDLRWKFFRPSGPPPPPPPAPQQEPAEAPAAMPEPVTEEPAMEEPAIEEPAREAAMEEPPPEPTAEEPAPAEAATPEAEAPAAAVPPPPMIPDQQPPPTDDPADEPPPVPVAEVEAEEPTAAGEVPDVERPSPPPMQPAPPERGEGLPEEAPASEPSSSEPSVAEMPAAQPPAEESPAESPDAEPGAAEPPTSEPPPTRSGADEPVAEEASDEEPMEVEPEPQAPEPEMPEPQMPEPGDAEPMPEPVVPEPAMPEPADRQPPVQEPPTELAPAEPAPTPTEAPAPGISQQPPAEAPQPVPPPRPAQPEPPPVEAAPVEPAPMAAPRFSVRSGAAGDCPDCKSEEIALSVERTVAPGDPGSGGDCGGGMAAAALEAASRLAARAEGLGSGMPLDGGGVASYTDPGASCQVLGVVLPPSARYRGYTYAVEAGGGAGGPCYFPDACPVAGAVWPQRPVIEQLGGGARMVYGVFRNAAAVPLRARLTVYYVAE